MIPIGVADARVGGWPVVTFAVAGASLLLTALVWLAPDATVDSAQAAVRSYAAEHGDELAPEGCLPHLLEGSPHQGLRQPASAEFERRCNAATEARTSGHQMRLALQPPGRKTPDLAWLLHPLAWTNPIAAIAGLLLLVLVVGSFVEDRYGRGPFAVALVASTAASALIWRWAAGEASDGWSGGQGYLAALLAVFVVTFATRPVKFLVLTPMPKMMEVPAWAVAVWWLLARALSLWVGDVDRPLVVAELVSFLAGGSAGVAMRMRKADKRGKPIANTPSGARVGPHAAPEDRRSSAPVARAGQLAATAPVQDPAAELPPVAPMAAAPDAAWAVGGSDPVVEPQIALRKRAAGQSVAPQPGVATPTPATAVAPGPTALPFEVIDESAQLAPAPRVFDFSTPVAIEFAGQGSGFASPLAAAVAQSTSAAFKDPNSIDVLQPPAAFDLEALLVGLPPPPVGERDTDIVAPPFAARAPDVPPPLAAQPSPYDEATVAYAPGPPSSQLLPAGADHDPTVPRVRLAARIDRAQDGVLLALVDDDWLRMDPPIVRAVAVGLVLHRDHPGAAPEIWIDVVTDTGSRDRPAHAVRLHPAREDLMRLLPEVAPSLAFARLAESLAAGGAFQLPQQPVWPGPPFPRYDTAAEFIRMWHRQLHG